MGPENCFLIGIWTGPIGQKIVKSYNEGPKEFWAQGFKDTADRARNYKMDQLGIDVIKEAHLVIYVIYFTSVVKLEIPKTSAPIFFMLCDAMR